MSDNCATCDQQAALAEFPLIGMVCESCRVKLTKATILDGVISSTPMVELCQRTLVEFESRRERLGSHARDICEGK